MGDGAQVLAFDGSVNGTAYTFSQNFSLNGMGWGEGGQNFGAIRVSGLNATFSGNLMLNGNSGLYIQNAPNSSMNVTGVISDGGSGYGLAINAIGGTVTLSNQNTYTGGTSINAGTLRILNSTASGAYSIAGGAKMYLDSTTAAAPSWSQITGAGTLELNSAQAVNGSANWGAPALSNAFTGTLQLDKGRINGTPANLGGATAVVIGNGAQFLAYDGTTNGTAYTFTQNLSINGMGWGEGGQDLGAIRVSGLNATFSGNLNLTGNSGLYTQNSQNTSMNVTGVISDGGSGYGLAINAIGGTITLSNQNTYTGATSVNAGKLVVNGSISTSSLITVASGATLGGSGTVGALTISGNLAPGGGGVDINTLSAGWGQKK